MIIAYHAIFTTYGTWLPNDPRGSYSKTIYKAELPNWAEFNMVANIRNREGLDYADSARPRFLDCLGRLITSIMGPEPLCRMLLERYRSGCN
jgi:hypothetical protein